MNIYINNVSLSETWRICFLSAHVHVHSGHYKVASRASVRGIYGFYRFKSTSVGSRQALKNVA